MKGRLLVNRTGNVKREMEGTLFTSDVSRFTNRQFQPGLTVFECGFGEYSRIMMISDKNDERSVATTVQTGYQSWQYKPES
jgi:hypothetical protein